MVTAGREVIPSVVSVNVLRREQARRGPFDFWIPRGHERTVRGLGSGYVIDERGYLLTNRHVIRGAVGDVILAANRRRIRTAGEAAEMLDFLSGRGPVLVQPYREGSLRTRTFYIR